MAGKNALGFTSNNRVIGWVISVIVHLLLILIILLFPKFVRDKPSDAYEGILVSFGLPIESEGDESGKNFTEPQEELDNIEPEDIKETQAEEEVEADLYQEESELVLDVSENVKPVKRQEQKPIEVPEPQPEKQLEKAKDDFGKLFSSKGNQSGKTGNQGDPLGEPNADNLEGISKGQGKVGGGLDERGILFEPEIIEQSQKSGRVVVKVCVDKTGKVISSKFTQRNSTTTDKDLVEIAEISARLYRFMPSEYEEQCGSITITFIVR